MRDDFEYKGPERFGQDWAEPGTVTVTKPAKPEPAPVPDTTGDDGELSNVPVPEDNWEVTTETAETGWIPFMLASPSMPGYLRRVHHAEFLEDSDEG